MKYIRNLFVYLLSFIQCISHSSMLKYAAKVIRWREKGHTGQSSVREIDVHTMYNQ